MNRIDFVTQYSSDVGTLRFTYGKSGNVYSYYFTTGTSVPNNWVKSFSKSPNSTGFLLNFIY